MKFAGQSYFKDDGSRTDGAGDGAPASPRAGRRRHRRRAALRAGVRQPVPREDPRPRRVPGDGAGLQRLARRLLLDRARPAHRQRADADLRHRRRRSPSSSACTRWASSRCSCSTARTAATRPKPEDDRFWEKALELDMALSPHMSFGGVMNIGGPRHDTVAVAGRSGHDPALADRAGAHDGAAHRERHVRAVPRAEASTSPRSTPRSSRRRSTTWTATTSSTTAGSSSSSRRCRRST